VPEDRVVVWSDEVTSVADATGVEVRVALRGEAALAGVRAGVAVRAASRGGITMVVTEASDLAMGATEAIEAVMAVTDVRPVVEATRTDTR